MPCLILFDSYKMISLLSPPLQAGLFFKLSCLSILGGGSSVLFRLFLWVLALPPFDFFLFSPLSLWFGFRLMSSLVRAVLCCFPCSLVFFTLGLSLPLSLSSLVFLLSFAFILASIFSVLYLQACSFSFSLASFFCSLSGLFVRFSLFMSSLLF